MTSKSSHNSSLAKSTRVRDSIVAIGTGITVLVFIILGIGKMSDTLGGDWISGEIVEKEFRPKPDTQISVGSKGLRKREVAGDYLFKVTVKGSEAPIFVWVDRSTYNTYRIGDRFKFPRPGGEED